MGIVEKGLVSIIIPVFNRENLLPETLDSILAQTYSQWECIIVDDGSSDASLEVALTYASNDSRFKVNQRPWYKKKGANTCRNYGLTLSKGEYIQWFDSDDLLTAEMLEEKISTFQRTNSDIVVCGASFFTESHQLNHSSICSIEPKTDNPAFEYFAGKFWFGTPQAMIKRIVILDLPYVFNSKLNRNQETELYVRLLLDDYEVQYLNSVMIFIRKHDFSISGNYSLLSEAKKYEINFPAYLSLYLEFDKREKLFPIVRNYFSDHFTRSLRKMRPCSYSYLKLFILGIIKNYFSSRSLALKIFLYRLFYV